MRRRLLFPILLLTLSLVVFGCDDSKTTVTDATSSETQSGDVRSDTAQNDVSQETTATCSTNADCANDPRGKACLVALGTCVECFDDSTCLNGFHCEMPDFVCVEDTGCQADVDCSGATPACDVGAQTCVACTADAHCGLGETCELSTHTCATAPCATSMDCVAPTPVCEVTNGLCVECITDGHCTLPATCDQASHTCQLPPCSSDADCSAPTPACDVASGDCLECLDNSYCTSPALCDTATHSCAIPVCGSDADCTAPTPACDTVSGACLQCLNNSHCTSPTICDTTINTCVDPPCTGNADCTAPTPVCETGSGVCFECLDNGDCTDPETCDTSTHTCVLVAACSTTADCGAERFARACDSATASCVECSATADCAAHEFANVCDGSACVECVTSADCAGSTFGTVCGGASKCVKCLDNTDCGGLLCDQAAGTCVACLVDGDCTSGTCLSSGHCGECALDVDCTSAAAPACDASTRTCVAYSACVGDDGAEDGDDGPAGATNLTPVLGDFNSVDRSICGSANEDDWFSYTAQAGENVTFTLTWVDAGADLDIAVMTADGTDLLGQSWFNSPEVVTLTYLPAGTFYVIVTKFSPKTTTVTPYTLSLTRSLGNACTSTVDCAADFATQRFRGVCNTGTGACEHIDGNGALGIGTMCDSMNDCASRICTYGPVFTDNFSYRWDMRHYANADTRAFCVAARCTASSDCAPTDACVLGFCMPKCTADAECPLSEASAAFNNAWPRMVCDTLTGECADG